jgi:hypothetical protein
LVVVHARAAADVNVIKNRATKGKRIIKISKAIAKAKRKKASKSKRVYSRGVSLP